MSFRDFHDYSSRWLWSYKSHWDNHKKCINCSHCFRESTCSTCSSWSNSVWDLAENRRTYPSRKKAMSSREKSENPSVSSDERKKKHGSTSPHGFTGRGKTYIGGTPKGVQVYRAMVTGHPTTNPISGRPGMPGHWPPGMPGHRATATGHLLTTGQTGDIETSCLPVTGHRPSSHRSLELC